MRIGQMMSKASLLPRRRAGLAWLALTAIATAHAQTATETVLHNCPNRPVAC